MSSVIPSLLSANELSLSYGQQRLLDGVTLAMSPGEKVGLVGRNGCGKTSLLKILSGEQNADTGIVSRKRGLRVGYLSQEFELDSEKTVLENIEVPLHYRGRVTVADRARCRELAVLVGLGDRLLHRPMQLSGGQQQRAAIARSLANDPFFMLADEPTGNLDSVTTAEILSLLERLNDAGKTIIIVTHEDDVSRHAKRIIRLRDGYLQSDELLDDSKRIRVAARALAG